MGTRYIYICDRCAVESDGFTGEECWTTLALQNVKKTINLLLCSSCVESFLLWRKEQENDDD